MQAKPSTLITWSSLWQASRQQGIGAGQDRPYPRVDVQWNSRKLGAPGKVPGKKNFLLLALSVSLLFPAFAAAQSPLLPFAGIVQNVPGLPGSYMSAGAMPTFPPPGVYTFWYPVGPGCINGVQEVNLLPLSSMTSPIMLQFVGQYTFPWGPATHPGQKITGRALPTMVCMANFVSWVYVGVALVPVVTPLPYFFAPLIIFNGSTP